MKAYVFINKTIPMNLGHVGWGFEIKPGHFCFGAKEVAGNLHVSEGDNNYVFVRQGSEQQMLSTMKKGVRYPYHFCKAIEVPHTNPAAAMHMAEDSKKWGYFILGNNCMDDVFKIIKCYANGNDTVLPWPSTHPTPNHFFHDIPAPEMKL